MKQEILFRVRGKTFSEPGTGLVHFSDSFLLPTSFNCMSATKIKQGKKRPAVCPNPDWKGSEVLRLTEGSNCLFQVDGRMTNMPFVNWGAYIYSEDA